MIELDGATALRLLREVVAEKPDYVYQVPGFDGGTCVYVAADQPSCVVGRVLAQAGYSIDVIHKLDDWGTIDFAINHVNEIAMDSAAIEILRRAQGKQDAGASWAAALTAAEDRAFTLGVTA